MKKIFASIIFQASVLIVVGQSKTLVPALNNKDVIGIWQGHYEQTASIKVW